MTQPTQREALPIWEKIIEAMKQGIVECRKDFSGTEDDDDLIAFMYSKIHNVLLEALQSPEMVGIVAKAIAWSELTPKGKLTCNFVNDFSAEEREEYREKSEAALLAIRERIKA